AALGLHAKGDASPVTAADLAAHRLIVDALRRLTPDVPVLSEEAADVAWETRQVWRRFWLVDPLDGTREFLSGNGEYTVNIALVEHHAPLLGVVHAPASGLEYSGITGVGAWRARGENGRPEPIRAAGRDASAAPDAPLRVVGSRSHRGDSLDALLARIGAHEFVPMGSSLKFCVLAEGGADVYPRLGPTSEWDTAAGHAVLLGAGGRVLQLDGAPLGYNRKPALLNPDFVACGDTLSDWAAWVRGRAR
ncbi:MAG: 3'(2'),5'-bisphosphate nucleotidase CysQ, partial [Gammaproteobacteria bacterium]